MSFVFVCKAQVIVHDPCRSSLWVPRSSVSSCSPEAGPRSPPLRSAVRTRGSSSGPCAAAGTEPLLNAGAGPAAPRTTPGQRWGGLRCPDGANSAVTHRNGSSGCERSRGWRRLAGTCAVGHCPEQKPPAGVSVLMQRRVRNRTL